MSLDDILRDEDLRATVPIADLSWKRELALVLDGARARFEDRMWRPLLNEDGVVMRSVRPSVFISVFDGVRGKWFAPKANQPYPVGTVARRDITHAKQSVEAIPLMVTYRGADWLRVAMDTENRPPLVGAAVIAGRECAVVESEAAHGCAGSYALWLEIDHEYRPARVVRSWNGKVISQTDIQYTGDADFQWVPKSWKTVLLYPSGDLQMQLEATVTNYELNPQLPDSTFDIQFEPGTYVFDEIANQEYIVRSGGARRIVHREEWERGATYEDLLASDAPAGSFRITPVAWLAASALMILSVSLVFYRYYKSVFGGSRGRPKRT